MLRIAALGFQAFRVNRDSLALEEPPGSFYTATIFRPPLSILRRSLLKMSTPFLRVGLI
jgi:hypothetical protein